MDASARTSGWSRSLVQWSLLISPSRAPLWDRNWLDVRAQLIIGAHAHHSHPSVAQATLTSICFGLACSLFGTCTVSTPLLNSAFTLLKSASSGRAKLRMNVP